MFLKVVETGSFTAAARFLGVPKSSASRGVAALERDLKTQLLQRTTRELKLTDSGRTFYERARGAMAALDEAQAELSQQSDDATGVVRLTIPNGSWPMPDLLVRFLKLHPKIHVDLVVTNRHVNLVEEGIDLALRAGKLEDSTLIVRKIATSHLGLFASRGYLKKRPAPKTFAQLADHDLIIRNGRQGKMKLKLTGPNGDEELEVHGSVGTDDMSTARGLIAAGLGIGLQPIFLETCGVEGAIERVLPDYALKGGGVHIVMPSARYVPTRVRLLSDFLAENFTVEACTKSHGPPKPIQMKRPAPIERGRPR